MTAPSPMPRPGPSQSRVAPIAAPDVQPTQQRSHAARLRKFAHTALAICTTDTERMIAVRVAMDIRYNVGTLWVKDRPIRQDLKCTLTQLHDVLGLLENAGLLRRDLINRDRLCYTLVDSDSEAAAWH